MRNFLTYLGLLFCGVLLAACGDDSDSASNQQQAAAHNPQSPAPFQCKITTNSIADIHLGDNINQIKQHFPNADIKPLQDEENMTFFSIRLGNDVEVFAYTDSANPNTENSPITYLDTASRNCKTEQGVHPFMELAQAEQIYGAVQQIIMSESEARQTAEFDQQPPELSFRIDDSGAFDPKDKKLPKITTDYQDGAKIHSIAVMSLPTSPEEKPN